MKNIIHVLCVDDDPDFLSYQKEFLENENIFKVETVYSVKAAFQLLNKKRFDVIVSDYDMPDKNGLQFLKQLRQKKFEIPFILLTQKEREIVIQALNLGVDRYIQKGTEKEAMNIELIHEIKKSYQQTKTKNSQLENEKIYRILFEESSDGLALTEYMDGSIIDCNSKFLTQTGRTKNQLKKMKIWDIYSPHLIDEAKKKFFEIKNRGTLVSSELDFMKPSGEIVNIDFKARIVEVEGKKIILNSYRDITNLKRNKLYFSRF